MRNYERKIYAAEFKLAAIEEFQSKNISIREFAEEKGIALSTFNSWLIKARKSGYQIIRRSTNHLSPIDVTKEAKRIIKDSDEINNGTFTLKIKSIVLTLPISSFKQVIEVISDD